MTRTELIVAAKLVAGALYLLALYAAPKVLGATSTIFDYARF